MGTESHGFMESHFDARVGRSYEWENTMSAFHQHARAHRKSFLRDYPTSPTRMDLKCRVARQPFFCFFLARIGIRKGKRRNGTAREIKCGGYGEDVGEVRHYAANRKARFMFQRSLMSLSCHGGRLKGLGVLFWDTAWMDRAGWLDACSMCSLWMRHWRWRRKIRGTT